MEQPTKTKLLYFAIALISLGVMLRLVPHPANFAPIGALAIFGGAVLPRKYALWVPLGAMVISDLVIGFYSGIVFTWAAFLAVGLFGMTLRSLNTWLKIGIGAFGGALIFFFISNFGVWAQGGLYPHTFAGLVQCYAMGLPFFRNTLLGDLFYNTLLLGTYALASRRLLTRQPHPAH